MRETRDELMLSSEPGDQQLDAIHAFLTRSYWAEGISRDVVQRSIEHSLCFGVFHQGNQVAFARVVTDQATVPGCALTVDDTICVGKSTDR